MAKKKKLKLNLKVLALWGSIGVGAVLLICTLILVLLPSYDGKTGFRTLQQMVAYAQRSPEHPPMDNTNLVRPDFTTFYDSQKNGFFSRKWLSLKNMLGMKKEDDWTPSYFVELLNDSLVRHRAHGIKKNIVYRVTPEVTTQLVLWGDIQGAYHSVVRSLQKLKELNIIDDNLKILAPKTYFVFMGDTVSRSAYGMQTLSLLLRLLQVNPERVVFLRGNHEDKKYWHAFGMKAQMKFFLSDMQEKAFVKEVDELFLYLPLGLYLPIPDEKHEFVRLSHLGSARSKKLKEERYTLFLHEDQKEAVDRHQIDKKTVDSTPVHIKAVIRSEKKRNDFQEMDGIRLLPPDQGATAWNLLSSPTKVTQEGLKFFHDAFATIKVGADKVNWSLTLYNQDVRQMNGYSTRSYQFFTGAEMGLDEIAAAEPPKPEPVVVEEKEEAEAPSSPETSSSLVEDPENKSNSSKEDSSHKQTAADKKTEKVKREEPKAKPAAKPKQKPTSEKKPDPAEKPAEKPIEKVAEKTEPVEPAKPVEPQHQTVLPPLPPAPTTASINPTSHFGINASSHSGLSGNTTLREERRISRPLLDPRQAGMTLGGGQTAPAVGAQPIVIHPSPRIPSGPYVTITIIPAPGTKIITTTQEPDASGKQETVIETQTVK